MLNPFEEDALRRIVRDHTPMVAVNKNVRVESGNADANQGVYIDNLVNRCVTAPRVEDIQFNDEAVLLVKVDDLLRKGETRLMQFVARTGISPTEIRNMSGTELKRRVALAAANEAHENDKGFFRPPRIIPDAENREANAGLVNRGPRGPIEIIDLPDADITYEAATPSFK